MIGKWALRAALLIAAGVLTAAIMVFASEYDDAPWMPSASWWALLGYTPIIFWATVRDFRRSWHQRVFWLWIAGLLVAHLLAYSLVLRAVTDWRPVWFLPLSLAEFVALVAILERLGFDSRPVVPKRKTRTVSVIGSTERSLPKFPITVRFDEDGQEWVLDSIEEIAGSLEWFDSDDPEERATVVDRLGRPVRLKVVQLDVIVCELVRTS